LVEHGHGTPSDRASAIVQSPTPEAK
jgi:hypothetical protein